MARCTKEQALETRGHILDAAEDVFHAKGVSNTSLADVAAAAGLTRGAIYWHFTNKGDLFEAMCQRVRLPMETVIEATADESTSDPLGQLREAGRFVLRQAVENPHHRKVLTILSHKCEFVDASDPIVIQRQQWLDHGQLNLERILTNAQARGQVPADLDLRLAALMLHVTFDGLLHLWLFAPHSFDLIADAEKILEASINCLRSNSDSLHRKPG